MFFHFNKNKRKNVYTKTSSAQNELDIFLNKHTLSFIPSLCFFKLTFNKKETNEKKKDK